MDCYDSLSPVSPHFVFLRSAINAVALILSLPQVADALRLWTWTLVARCPPEFSPRRRQGLPGSWVNPIVNMPCSSTPGDWIPLGLLSVPVLPSAALTTSAPLFRPIRGSLTRPAHSVSTLRSVGYPTTTQDSLLTGGQPLSGRIQYLPGSLSEGFRNMLGHASSPFSRLNLAQQRLAYPAQSLRLVANPVENPDHVVTASVLLARKGPIWESTPLLGLL
jgi:hypothetical protein